MKLQVLFLFFFLFCYADFRLKTHPAAKALGLTCHAPFCAIVFNTVSKPEVEMRVETCSDWKSWESRMYYPQFSAELTNETIISCTCTTTTGSSSPHGPLIWTRGALRGNMAQYIWIYLRKGRLTLLSARTWAPAAPTRSLRPDEAICCDRHLLEAGFVPAQRWEIVIGCWLAKFGMLMQWQPDRVFCIAFIVMNWSCQLALTSLPSKFLAAVFWSIFFFVCF